MENQFSVAAEGPSAVDVRCAVVLARVALQTLSDLSVEAASAIDHALEQQIRVAEKAGGAEAKDVIALLSSVRAEVKGEEPTLQIAENGNWYIE